MASTEGVVEEQALVSGELQKYGGGATRSSSADKPDYEGFINPEVLVMYGEYMHAARFQRDGTFRESDNWQQGIPKKAYMKSLLRHVIEMWFWHRTGRMPVNKDTGVPFTPQQLFSAIMFNIMGYAKEHLNPAPVNQE